MPRLPLILRASTRTINRTASAAALLLSCAALPCLLTLAGCALALPGYNEPFDEKLAVLSSSPQVVEIRIAGSQQESTRVPTDGRVVLHFPVLPRECSTYLLGVRVKDRSVEARKIVEFVRDGRVIRRMSVRDLRRLPVDQAGYHGLKLK